MTRWQELVVEELREVASKHTKVAWALNRAADDLIDKVLADEACDRASVTLKEAGEEPSQRCHLCGATQAEVCQNQQVLCRRYG